MKMNESLIEEAKAEVIKMKKSMIEKSEGEKKLIYLIERIQKGLIPFFYFSIINFPFQ